MNLNRPSFFANVPPATLNIIIINILVWVASQIVPGRFGFDMVQHFGMHYFASDAFNPIQLVTYMFMHDTSSIMHLFFNMFGLYMFGVVLEQVWGWRKYLFFYLMTGIGAALIQQAVWALEFAPLAHAFNQAIAEGNGELLISQSNVLNHYFNIPSYQSLNLNDMIMMKHMIFNSLNTIGASGALFGILFAFGWMFPQVKLFLLFIPIPIPARVFVIIYGVIELFLGVANFSGDNVAHFAHLGGALIAVVMVLIWRKRGKLFSNKI